MKLTEKFRKEKRTTLLNDTDTEYNFNLWEKHGLSRVYVKYREKRTVGYIDVKTGEYHGDDCKAYLEMVEKFISECTE